MRWASCYGAHTFESPISRIESNRGRGEAFTLRFQPHLSVGIRVSLLGCSVYGLCVEGFRVWVAGVEGLGLRFWSSGFRFEGSELRIKGSGFRAWVLGSLVFGVQGLKFGLRVWSLG